MPLTGTQIDETLTTAQDVPKVYLPAVSQDVTTPEEYWGAGADVPATARNRRFYIYSLLYDGDTEYVANASDFPIVFAYRNWFSEVANFYRDFLMNAPPESTSDLQEMLNDELRIALVHLIAHGVCIFAVEEGLIEAIDPRYFYPLPEPVMDDESGTGEDEISMTEGQIFGVEVAPAGPGHIMVRSGTFEYTFTFKGESVNWAYPDGEIGDLVSLVEGMPERVYYTVALAPEDGFYGASVFKEMLPAVGQHTELFSSYLSQLKTSANILTGTRAPGSTIRTNLPDAASSKKDGSNNIKLAQLYGTLVEGLENLSFVGGVISPESFKMPLDRIEQSIYSIAGISPTLAGQYNDQSVLIASGVAFEKSFIRTGARLNEILQDFLPVLARILAAAGAPAPVEWEHPLRALDMQSRGETSTPASEPDTPTAPEPDEDESESDDEDEEQDDD